MPVYKLGAAAFFVSNTPRQPRRCHAVTRAYTANGLNQYTASGSVTPTYDARGNMTSAGSTTYSYTADNRMATSTSGTYREMMDDSLDRLHRYYDGSANRWLLYDGHSLIAETNSSGTAIARRYVHGPGPFDRLRTGKVDKVDA